MDPSGGIDVQLALFQLFFMVAGSIAGVRVVDDVRRWREARVRAESTTDV